jgi:methyl-accepting chemotaxis protein
LPLLESVRLAIGSELGGAAERVRELVDYVVRLTEREVVAAGRQIAKINGEAKSSVEAMDRLAHAAEVYGQTMDDALNRQAVSLRDYSAKFNANLERQQSATTAIVDVGEKIGAYVESIERVSTELRVLTLNARIAAMRRGDQGRAFDIIGANMGELTREVDQMNKEIGELARALSGIVARVTENETALEDLGRKLGADLSMQIKSLAGAHRDSREQVSRNMRESQDRARHILDLARGMLTNLQFQDRMTQSLYEVKAVLGRAVRVTEEVFARAADGVESAKGIVAALNRAREQAGPGVVRMSGESELESSDRGQQSGTVELF